MVHAIDGNHSGREWRVKSLCWVLSSPPVVPTLSNGFSTIQMSLQVSRIDTGQILVFSDIGKDPVWITRDATWIARQTVHSHLFSHRGWTVILMADMNLLLAGLRALLDNYFSFLTVSVSATTLVLFSNEFKLTFLRSGNLRRRKRYSRRSTSRNLFRVHVTIDSTIR